MLQESRIGSPGWHKLLEGEVVDNAFQDENQSVMMEGGAATFEPCSWELQSPRCHGIVHSAASSKTAKGS
jgi:hypothetical protein